MKVNKTALDFSDYEKYSINQYYSAYKIDFEQILEQQCEDLELEYQQQGYKIFHSDLKRSSGEFFNLTLIVAKSAVAI